MMKYRGFVIFLVLCADMVTNKGQDCRQFTFQKHRTADQNLVSEFDGIKSQYSCAKSCANNRECISFFYDRNTSLCILFNKTGKSENVTGTKNNKSSLESVNMTETKNNSTSFVMRYSCSGTSNKDRNEIYSRHYPRPYSNYEHCAWRITTNPGFTVKLHFDAFQIESHRYCNYDYLEIRNGPYSTSRWLRKLCGYQIPKDIESTSNHLYIRFYTDRYETRTGFKASYSKVAH